MLTKEDLEQLRAVVRDEVRSQTALVNSNVQKLQAVVWTVKENVKSLTGDVLVLKEDIQGLKQDVQGLKDGQARIEQRLDRVDQKVDHLERMAKDDGEILGDISARLNDVLTDHDVRIERLEKHTGLSHS